jgi:hypothetical protein
MKLLSILKFAQNAGRTALAVGGVGSAVTWGAGDVIEIVANLTALVGAVSEAVVRIIVAKAKASGKLPIDAVL